MLDVLNQQTTETNPVILKDPLPTSVTKVPRLRKSSNVFKRTGKESRAAYEKAAIMPGMNNRDAMAWLCSLPEIHAIIFNSASKCKLIEYNAAKEEWHGCNVEPGPSQSI